MRVKNGDIVEFIAISWDEPQWEFDYPTVVLKPSIAYSPSGKPTELMIENMAIDLACGVDRTDQDVSEEFNWRGWKISNLKKVASDRLNGKDTWKTKIREVVKQRIKFIEEDGQLEFEVLETITA
jgi:hypothetical protein